jgi:FtsH-binding integral membrane protein
MFFALALTAVTAYCVAQAPGFVYQPVTNKILFYGLIFGQLGLVLFLSSAIQRLSFVAAFSLFTLYAFTTGMLFSTLFFIYSTVSIAETFCVTAAVFAVMSLYGYLTGRDLTTMGNLCLMAVVGLIIGGVVNLFLQNALMDFVISSIGVLVFTGLIAYDTQKLKYLAEMGHEDNEGALKIALLGALTLYLDFINLFLYLLRFLGRKKD